MTIPAPSGLASSFDVAVVGAGPAGAAAAIALRQRGFSVALLERAQGGAPGEAENDAFPRQVWHAGESVAAVAQYPLRELGLWDAFQLLGPRPSYLTQSAWGSDELTERHSISQKAGPDYHVDRERFDAWLRERAVAAGAELFGSTTARSVDWNGDTRRFTLSCWPERAAPDESERARALAGPTFEARHLIDATGRPAWLLRRLGGQRTRLDELICVGRRYEQARFEPSMLVEAVQGGWWYSCPLPEQKALALYLTLADSAKAARTEEGWQGLVAETRHTRPRLESALSAGPIRVCSAAPTRSVWDSALPFLPVGDAAVSFDPVAGTGLCFAFRSALEAAMVLDEARAGRAELFTGYQRGVQNVLEEHLQRRRELYAHERRFPESGFWSRVHAETSRANEPS